MATKVASGACEQGASGNAVRVLHARWHKILQEHKRARTTHGIRFGRRPAAARREMYDFPEKRFHLADQACAVICSQQTGDMPTALA
jgi:hypothetical protein